MEEKDYQDFKTKADATLADINSVLTASNLTKGQIDDVLKSVNQVLTNSNTTKGQIDAVLKSANDVLTNSNTAKAQIDAILKSVNDVLTNSNTAKGQIDVVLKNINVILTNSNTSKGQIDAVLKSVNDVLTNSNTAKEQIDIVLKGINDVLTNSNTVKRQIDDVLKSVNEVLTNSNLTKGQIDDVLKNVTESLKSIENYKTDLFGDEANNIVGIKQRIQGYEKNILEKQTKWEESFGTLFNKIEGLLPGATSTGLAKAYQDQRNTYTKPYWLWAIIFVLTIVGMVCFACITLKEVNTVDEAFMRIISRLPFFIPTFWLAIFASKQQSQNKRLQQEYAYKETLTKSYEADKREIEKLPESEERNKLSIKLLDAVIEMAKNNPSETLHSASHNDGPPSVLDIFKMKALKKITGKEEQ